MKSLTFQPLAIAKFTRISWDEFNNMSNFTEECVIPEKFGEPSEKPKTHFYDKTIRNLVSELKLDPIKKIILFSFYLNTIFEQLQNFMSSEDNWMGLHILGLYRFLSELEHAFKKKDKSQLTPSEKEIKRIFFCIKRRIFDIFIYFNCPPQNLEELIDWQYSNAFRQRCPSEITNKDIMFAQKSGEYKKKRCLQEYYRHYIIYKEKEKKISISNFDDFTKYINEFYQIAPTCLSEHIKNEIKLLAKYGIALKEGKEIEAFIPKYLPPKSCSLFKEFYMK